MRIHYHDELSRQTPCRLSFLSVQHFLTQLYSDSRAIRDNIGWLLPFIPQKTWPAKSLTGFIPPASAGHGIASLPDMQ